MLTIEQIDEELEYYANEVDLSEDEYMGIERLCGQAVMAIKLQAKLDEIEKLASCHNESEHGTYFTMGYRQAMDDVLQIIRGDEL